MEAQGGFVPLVLVKECGVMGKPGYGHIKGGLGGTLGQYAAYGW